MITDFPLLSIQTSISELMQLAFEFNIFHFPISNNGNYLGSLALDMLNEDEINENKKVADFKEDLILFSVKDDGYILNSIFEFAEKQTSSAAVINSEGQIIGLLRSNDIFKYLANSTSYKEEGVYISLKLETRDYNLQEIARIVESNNAKILSLQIESSDNKNDLLVTIKINSKNISHVLATFDRFDYNYVTHAAIDTKDEYYLGRYNLLMKYLNL